MITVNASNKIQQFNDRGLHYNLVADAVYKVRNSISDPFGSEYLPYIIAALISFDMGRMMGSTAERKYSRKTEGFANHLEKKLAAIKPYIGHLINLGLDVLSPRHEQENIKRAYDILSSSGKNGLNQREGEEFHVGATKIMHFLNPEAFVIVDSNAARAFRQTHLIKFRNTTQPGYSGDKYIDCMEYARKDILNFGVVEFRALEKGVPMTRIYDKLTFITGSSVS
jgi:hypothetical protein